MQETQLGVLTTCEVATSVCRKHNLVCSTTCEVATRVCRKHNLVCSTTCEVATSVCRKHNLVCSTASVKCRGSRCTNSTLSTFTHEEDEGQDKGDEIVISTYLL